MSAHMFIDCFQCKRCSFCGLAVQVAVRLSDGNHEVLPYWFCCVGCVATPAGCSPSLSLAVTLARRSTGCNSLHSRARQQLAGTCFAMLLRTAGNHSCAGGMAACRGTLAVCHLQLLPVSVSAPLTAVASHRCTVLACSKLSCPSHTHSLLRH
jgi:hypothetical protein